MKKLILLLAFALMLFTSCQNTKQKPVEKQEHNAVDTTIKVQDVQSLPDTNQKFISVKAWIDDFKNFREAVYSKDVAKLKTYFQFPINEAESSGLWHLVNLSKAEYEKRKAKYANTGYFYEEDFEKYYNRIFNDDFCKAILKVKTKAILDKKSFETPWFVKNDQAFSMIVNYYDTEQSALYLEEQTALYLNMSYVPDFVDENGEKVSEGEYNIIYIFNVDVDGKPIKFRTIIVAG